MGVLYPFYEFFQKVRRVRLAPSQVQFDLFQPGL